MKIMIGLGDWFYIELPNKTVLIVDQSVDQFSITVSGASAVRDGIVVFTEITKGEGQGEASREAITKGEIIDQFEGAVRAHEMRGSNSPDSWEEIDANYERWRKQLEGMVMCADH